MSAASSRAALAVAASLLALGGVAAAPAAPRAIEDDYPAALAQARKLGVPLVVDVWAPW